MSGQGLPEVPETKGKREEERGKSDPSLFGAMALDLDFLTRVYKTGGIVLAILGMLLWAKLSAPAGAGFVVGGILSMIMLWGMEVTVRALIKPESRSAKGLIFVMIGKLLVATLVLVLCLMAALRGWLNLIWLLAGFSLPHGIVMLKLLGRAVKHVYAQTD